MTARLTALLGAYMGDRHGLLITEENPLKFWEQWILVSCHSSHTTVFQDSTDTMVGQGFSFDIAQVSSDQKAAFQVRTICMMQYKFVSAILCHSGSCKVPKLKLCHFLLLCLKTLILSCFRRVQLLLILAAFVGCNSMSYLDCIWICIHLFARARSWNTF